VIVMPTPSLAMVNSPFTLNVQNAQLLGLWPLTFHRTPGAVRLVP
jgi:hypothetical protein